MRFWLLQRSEPTPFDDGWTQRLLRTGHLAQTLSDRGHEVVWWTSTFDHYSRRHRFSDNHSVTVEGGCAIEFLRGSGYTKNVSLQRLRDNSQVADSFSKIARDRPTPDLILASVPTIELASAAVSYGSGRGVPVFLDVRDLWPDVFADLVPSWTRPLVRVLSRPMNARLRATCRQATGIIGLTPEFVNWGVSKAGRHSGQFDQHFPMGYVVDEPSPPQPRRQAPQRLAYSGPSETVDGDLAGRAGQAAGRGPAGRPAAGRDELGMSARAAGAAPVSGPDPRRLATNRGEQAEKKPVQVDQEPGRNDACPCGSGKKYKKC
jgi:hypothetical protein